MKTRAGRSQTNFLPVVEEKIYYHHVLRLAKSTILLVDTGGLGRGRRCTYSYEIRLGNLQTSGGEG